MTTTGRDAETKQADSQTRVSALSRIPSRSVLWVCATVMHGAICAALLGGCGQTPTPPAETKSGPAAEAKPATPAVPDEIMAAAKTLLGSEVQVVVFGDLAKTGNQEFLAANVLPKTPTNNIPGLVVTRAVVVENNDGKWTELLHVDEHLKNQKGFLALTPLQPISAWRLQTEQDPIQGLRLYFTPVKTSDPHVLTIGVRWNPKVKRYQSMDRTYEKFLPEAPQLGQAPPRSSLR